jgi:hypothetical protein
MGHPLRRLPVGAVAVLLVVASACSGGSDARSGSSASGAPAARAPATSDPLVFAAASTGTTRPLVRWSASITGEHEVSPGFRQGLAHDADGTWIFSTNLALYRTDAAFGL